MKTKTFTILMSLTVLAAACSGEKQNATDDVKIAVHPFIKTRATDTDFEQGDKIGVTIKLDGSSLYKENAELVHNGEYFEAEDIKWYSPDKEGVFEAYYPFERDYRGNFSISPDQSGEGYGDSDLLMAMAENVQPQVRGVSLSFKHVMSQMVVKVYNNSKYDITGVTIGNVKGDVRIDFEEMTVWPLMSAKPKSVKTQLLGEDTYRAIISPQEAAVVITIHTDGGPDVSKTLDENSFDVGRSYRAVMTLTDEFDITDVEILSSGEIGIWEDGGTIS